MRNIEAVDLVKGTALVLFERGVFRGFFEQGVLQALMCIWKVVLHFHSLILILSDSPEIQPKFVKGSKRYGRRSTPEFIEPISDFSEVTNANLAEGEDLEDNYDSAVPRKREVRLMFFLRCVFFLAPVCTSLDSLMPCLSSAVLACTAFLGIHRLAGRRYS